MMKKFILFLSFIANYSFAQLSENFSDGDFTSNPSWVGNNSEFIVNTSLQLQLNNTIANASYLTTPLALSSLDNIEWRFYYKQSFSPSSNNYGRIYLTSDTSNLSFVTAGYYLQFGEAGSSDAIELYQQTGTVSTLICRGTNGLIASSFAIGIKVTRDIFSNWKIYVDATGGTAYVIDASGTENTYTNSKHFGIAAVYTISNSTKFYLDDIFVGPISIDSIPPSIKTLSVLNNNQIDLLFDEKIDAISSQTKANFVLDNGIGNPIAAIRDTLNDSLVHLTFASTFTSGTNYLLIANNIKDISGNSLVSDSIKFLYNETKYNDIVINEILADPNSGGVDFVEIYNRSNKIIDLKTISLSQFDTVNNIPINLKPITLSSYLMYPETYIVLSKDGSAVKSQYNSPNPANFIDLPSMITMNISSGTVCLSTATEVIDLFVYNENMHFPLLNSTKGVTLERIDFNRPTQDKTNWHSASKEVGYGTPAYKNSQYNDAGEADDAFEITPEIFSPDEDGYNDVVNINYKFDTPGYVGNVTIYDSKGRLTKLLLRNELLGTSGTFSWDGINESREKARIGIYIIFIEVFDLAGNVKKYKKTCVLGGRL